MVERYDMPIEMQKRCRKEAFEISDALMDDFNEIINKSGPSTYERAYASSLCLNATIYTLRTIIEMIPDDQLQDNTLKYVEGFLRGDYDE